MALDLLLHSATILTMDPERRTIDDGAVLVSEGKIVATGPTPSVLSKMGQATVEKVNCQGKLILPGFVDAHAHAGHALVKTLGVDTPSLWFKTVTEAYFHHTSPRYWYLDGLVSALERVRAGVTCGLSVMGSQPRSDDPRCAMENARAYAEVGIREIIGVGPSGLPWPVSATRWTDGVPEHAHTTFEEMLAGTEAVIESCNQPEGLIRVYATPFTLVPSLSIHGPTPADLAIALTPEDRLQTKAIRNLAAKWGVRIHSDAYGGMIRLAAQDGDSALLGPDVHLQHCVGASEEEVSILAETGTHVSHAPGGKAPVPAMLRAGIPMAIASEGNSRRPMDLLQAARGAQTAQRLLHDDPFLLPPGRALEMITIEAAEVVGLEDKLGSIELGKQADLVILDLHQPHLTPNWMLAHRLIFEAVGRDVESVIVDGQFVMRDRRVLNVDEPAALAEATAESWALVDRAGLEKHLTSPGWGKGRLEFGS